MLQHFSIIRADPAIHSSAHIVLYHLIMMMVTANHATASSLSLFFSIYPFLNLLLLFTVAQTQRGIRAMNAGTNVHHNST